MKLIIYFSLIAFAYFALVLFWRGRKKLKALNNYKGTIGYSINGMMGIVGATVMLLQIKVFTALSYSQNSAFLLSTLLMIVLSCILYFLFVRNNKVQIE